MRMAKFFRNIDISRMKLINLTKNQILAENMEHADTALSRMRGLLGRDAMLKGSALLIKPCKGVHTFGMKFPIDVIFLDRENKVLAIRKNLKPNALTRIFIKAASVLELPVNTIDSTNTETGDRIGIV